MFTNRINTALIAAALALAASGSAAQSLTGRVVEDSTEQPISGARVLLLDAEDATRDETFSADDGRFALDVPEAGLWAITVEHIGHGTIRSEHLDLTPDGQVVLEVRMGIEPVSVGSVVVTARYASMSPDIRAFYRRVERGRTSGLGRFVTREDIEEQHPLEPSDMLRTMSGVRVVHQSRGGVSGVNVIRMAGGCVPAIYVDGTQINRVRGMSDNLDDMVAVASIEGIEVYRGAGAQVSRFHDDRGCGLILVWTRRGVDEGEPFSWGRFLAGLGVVAGIFLIW